MKTLARLFSIIAILAITLTPVLSQAQILEPVKWKYTVKELGDNKAELRFEASIEKKWHIYSQFNPEGGALPMIFHFNESSAYKKIGTVKEPTPKEEYNEIFKVTELFFKDKAVFKQVINKKSNEPFKVDGFVEYQVCIEGSCMPGEADFEFNVSGAEEVVVEESQDTAQADTSELAEVIPDTNKADTAVIQAATDTGTMDFEEENLLGFFFAAFVWGLLAILTPCVFPMIPMTVSYFMKEKGVKGRVNSMFYGFFIIAIYTVIGSVFALLFGADAANWLSTHWLPNILFFIIFVIFAASFFGAFDIVLPSWMINKSDRKADSGGIGGAFFMALTLVLVSFSCTGPLVGNVLVMAAGGQFLKPIVGMFGFSLAFALPFTLFAIFPQWLNKLPKSGGWLNSVKVVLGFIELALGLKFLSVADQTYHWGLLDREIYLAFWIVIFTLMGFYLLGKIKFPHDSDVKHIGIFRLFFVIVTFTFVVYLIPGMFGAPLKALSGYMPPSQTHDFDLNKIIRDNVTYSTISSENTHTELCDKPKYSDFLHLPHGLHGYFDFEQGLACAKEQNKPIFIDFTGHGCVNCREMEANVWSDPRVLKKLQEDFLIITLYVDDKTKLPESEWITSEYDGKVKKSVGKKYADFQIDQFGVNAQPYYVILDNNIEKGDKVKKHMLTKSHAYNKSVEDFLVFLNDGLAEFEKRHPESE